MTPWPTHGPARARSARLAVLVLCGHVLLAALLASALAPTPRWRARTEPTATVWMQWLAPAIQAPQSRVAKPTGNSPAPQQASPHRDAPANPEPPAPLAAAPAAAQPQAITVPDAPATAASRPPLDLTWRGPRQPGHAASQAPATWARDDPRLNRPAGTEDRMARDLGADPRLIEEDRGDVRRFRQGSGCVDVRSARESQLNPWNQSAHATPRQAKAC